MLCGICAVCRLVQDILYKGNMFLMFLIILVTTDSDNQLEQSIVTISYLGHFRVSRLLKHGTPFLRIILTQLFGEIQEQSLGIFFVRPG